MCVIFCQTLAIDMSDVERDCTARRRREAPPPLVAEPRAADRAVFALDLPPRRSSKSSGWEGTSSMPPNGDRTRQGPGRPRTARRRQEWPGTRRSSICTTRKTPCEVRGLPAWQSRRGRRSALSGTPWSSAPMAQILDDPVPQTVLKIIDIPVPKQVIEVPKILSQDSIPQRAVLQGPQLVQQLVEVPVPSFRHCVRCGDAVGGRAGTVQRHCCQCSEPGGSIVGYKTHPMDPPEGTHRQPRAVNTRQA